MNPITQIEFILYVSNQEISSRFYEKILGQKPTLEVPGITEFMLGEKTKLGLMPNTSIAKIISPTMPHPEKGNGIPRCELYLQVENLEAKFQLLKSAGAICIQEIKSMNWGDQVCYFADPDGHVIAFAKAIS